MPQMQFVVGFGFCLFVCFYFKPHTEMKREGKKATTTGYAPSKTHWLHLPSPGYVLGPEAQEPSYPGLSSQLELRQALQHPQ